MSTGSIERYKVLPFDPSRDSGFRGAKKMHFVVVGNTEEISNGVIEERMAVFHSTWCRRAVGDSGHRADHGRLCSTAPASVERHGCGWRR